MASSVRTPPENELIELMVAFLQLTQRAAERAMQGEGVSPAQFFVLDLLTRQGPIDQQTITQATGGTAGNTSQLIAKLEAAGLARRTSSGRRKLVSVTDRGSALADRLRPERDAFLRRQFAPLGRSGQRALARTLRVLLLGKHPGGAARSDVQRSRASSARPGRACG